MTVIGKCAYPNCRLGVVLQSTDQGDWAPVGEFKGAQELTRRGGGAHGLVDGGERIGYQVWHKRCYRADRDERRNGEQSELGL